MFLKLPAIFSICIVLSACAETEVLLDLSKRLNQGSPTQNISPEEQKYITLKQGGWSGSKPISVKAMKADGTDLQIGAFENIQRALTLRNKLEISGFTNIEVRSAELYRVIIPNIPDYSLSKIQSNLDNKGFPYLIKRGSDG